METNNYLEQIHENLCAGKNYNSGTRCAVGNYRTTLRCAADEYIVRENPHRIDIEDFVDTLRKAGITDGMKMDEAAKIEELIDIHRQMESITAEDSYTRGFRDGAKLMLDMLNG